MVAVSLLIHNHDDIAVDQSGVAEPRGEHPRVEHWLLIPTLNPPSLPEPGSH